MLLILLLILLLLLPYSMFNACRRSHMAKGGLAGVIYVCVYIYIYCIYIICICTYIYIYIYIYVYGERRREVALVALGPLLEEGARLLAEGILYYRLHSRCVCTIHKYIVLYVIKL